MRAPRSLLLVTLAGGVLAASGCGASDDEATVRTTAERFLAAYEDQDGNAACAELSEETVKTLEDDEGKRCARAILDVKVEPGSIARVQVYAGNAKVDLSNGESAFLSDDSVGWRLSALACTPEEGKPADKPFDCELES